MLLAAGGAAVAGAWAVWRGHRQARRVPTLRFWVDGAAVAPGRRKLDPLWVIVALAAVLAGGALARPAWRPAAAAIPWGRFRINLRAMPSPPAGVLASSEAWIQLVDGQSLPDKLTLTADSDAARIALPTVALRRGIAIALPRWAGDTQRLRIMAGPHLVAEAAFAVPLTPRFIVRTISAPGRTIDPALARVFAVQPGAARGDASGDSTLPMVLLVNDPSFPTSSEPLTAAQLIVAMGPSALPGIEVLDAQPVALPAGMHPVPAPGADLPVWVHFDDVEVRAAVRVRLSEAWQVLAKVDGRPWLARRAASGPTSSKALWLWLGSSPAAQSNWVAEPSFVSFFTDILRQALIPVATAPAAALSAGGVEDWQVIGGADAGQTEVIAGREPHVSDLPLGPPILLIAAAALVAALAGFVARHLAHAKSFA